MPSMSICIFECILPYLPFNKEQILEVPLCYGQQGQIKEKPFESMA